MYYYGGWFGGCEWRGQDGSVANEHVIDDVAAINNGTVMEDGIVIDKAKSDQVEEGGGWCEHDYSLT